MIVIVLAGACPLAVRGATKTSGSTCPTIQQAPVRLFNDAAVGTEVLHPATDSAAWILVSLCVEVMWIPCTPLSRWNPSHCEAPAGALELHILPAPQTSDFREDTLGTAIFHLGEGKHAAVFLSHIRETAARNTGIAGVPDVMGCAIAHEIGHLLLHSASHSSEGIMRGDLRRSDLKKAVQRQLTFTPEQREVLRQKSIHSSVN